MKKNRMGTVLLSVMISFLMVFMTASLVSADKLEDIKAAIEEKGAKWKAGETSISKLPDAEKKLRLGLVKQKPTGKEKILSLEEPPTVLPSSLDWNSTTADYVTGVRNQGSCGSCWAFAATAALESYLLFNRILPLESDRSEQVLVSCSGAGSCSGGYISLASSYIRDYGLPEESCFPYTATNNKCRNACSDYRTLGVEKIYSWDYVCTTGASVTVDAIKNALYTYGPLVTTMDVYGDFFSYSSGVYSYATGSYQGGHAILITGYSDDSDSEGGGYFIVKNSWGNDWGEAGFFRIAYSELRSRVYFGEWTIAYHKPDMMICSYAIEPTSVTIPKAGGEGSFTVNTTGDSCPWSASAGSDWILITSIDSTAGTVGYFVTPNTTRKNRTGTIAITEGSDIKATFTITQLRK